MNTKNHKKLTLTLHTQNSFSFLSFSFNYNDLQFFLTSCCCSVTKWSTSGKAEGYEKNKETPHNEMNWLTTHVAKVVEGPAPYRHYLQIRWLSSVSSSSCNAPRKILPITRTQSLRPDHHDVIITTNIYYHK